jgi:hypothetical protein
MRRISVRGEVLAFPKMCCCCCDSKAKRRYKAQADHTGRWDDECSRERRWWYFPICKRCDRWIRATRAASLWLILFVVSITIGVFGLVPWGLVGFLSMAGAVCGFFTLSLLVFSAVAFAVWQLQRSLSLRLDPGPPCSIYPVVLTEWLRDKHTFEFANTEYFHQFVRLNRDLVS